MSGEETSVVATPQRDLMPVTASTFIPAFTPKAIAEGMVAYRNAIKAIVSAEDIVKFKQKDKDGKQYERAFIKKSGYAKIALYFGVNTGTVAAQWGETGDTYAWKVTAYVEKGGRRVERSALCSSDEKDHMAYGRNAGRMSADMYATAQTRAISMATAAFFGTGDVGADEITRTDISQLSEQVATIDPAEQRAAATAAASAPEQKTSPQQKQKEKAAAQDKQNKAKDPDPKGPPTKQQLNYLHDKTDYKGPDPPTWEDARNLLEEYQPKQQE